MWANARTGRAFCFFIEDEPRLRRTVGIDKQYWIIERQADMMAREVAAGMGK